MNYSKKKSSVIFPHTYCKAEYPEWLKSFRKDFVGNDFLDSRHNVKMFCCVALLDVNYICCNGIIMLCFVWCNLLIKNMFNVQSLYRLEIAVEQQTHVWLNLRTVDVAQTWKCVQTCCETLWTQKPIHSQILNQKIPDYNKQYQVTITAR